MQHQGASGAGSSSKGYSGASGASVPPSDGTKKGGGASGERRVIRRLRGFYRVTGIDRIGHLWLLGISVFLLALTLGGTAAEMYLKRQLPSWADDGTWTADRPIQFHHELTLPALNDATINVVTFTPDSKRVWIGGDTGLLAFTDDQGQSWTQLFYDSTNGCFHDSNSVCPPQPQTKTPPPASIQKQAPTPAATPPVKSAAPPQKPDALNPSRPVNSKEPSTSKAEQANPASQTKQNAAPNRGTSPTQTNPSSTAPSFSAPKVVILTPATGDRVSGIIQVSVNATDSVGVVGVQLLVDGVKAGPESIKPPYVFPLATATLSEGKHLLTAVARNAAGSIGTSPPVGIEVYSAATPSKKGAALWERRPRKFQGARLLNARFAGGSLGFFSPRIAGLEEVEKKPSANPSGRTVPSAAAGAANSPNGAQVSGANLAAARALWLLQNIPDIYGLEANDAAHLGLTAIDGRVFTTEDTGKTWVLSRTRGAASVTALGTFTVLMGRRKFSFDFTSNDRPPELRGADAEVVLQDDRVFRYSRSSGGVEVVSGNKQITGQALASGVDVNAVAASKDGKHLWYVLSGSAPFGISRSDDLGKNWKSQFIATGFELLDLSFDSPGSHGFAVGDHGAILGTLDGGDHWYPASRGALAPGVPVKAARTSAKNERWPWDWPGEWPWERPWRLPPLWSYVGLLVGLILLGGGLLPPVPLATPEGIANISAGDVPIERPTEDALHFAPFVRGLSGLIRNRNTKLPLTIAINGGWGSGKTSLMNMLRFDLDAAGLRTVWFNAWHHQEEPNLLAALLQTVRKEAAPALLEAGGLWYRAKLLWTRVLANPWNTLLVAAIAAGLVCGEMALHSSRPRFYLDVALGVKCVVQPVEPKPAERTLLEQIADILIKLAGGKAADVRTACGGASEQPPEEPDSTVPHGVFLLVLLAGLWPKLGELLKSFGANPAQLLATVSSGKSTSELEAQTSFRETFKKQYRDVTKALLPRRLTIFIDDVDRCKPDKVAEMLEAVNYVVVAGPCAVVMGLENIAVEAGLGRSFKDMAEETLAYRALNEAKPAAALTAGDFALRRDFAQQYNRKLLNVVINVPSADEAKLGKLVGVSEDELTPEEKAEREQALADERMVRKGRYARFVLVGAAAFSLAVLGGLLLGDFLSSQFLPREKHTASSATGVAPAKVPGAVAAENTPVENLAVQGPAPAGSASVIDNRAVAQKPSVPAPSLTPAETAIPGAWTAGRNGVVLGAILLLAIAALMPKLLQSKSVSIDDSLPVKEALKIWSPVIAKVTRTPREYKRLLNRIRYLALAANPIPPERPLWRRLWATSKREKPATGAAEQAVTALPLQAFPEPMLVAAAVNKEVEKMIPKLSPVEAADLRVLATNKMAEFTAKDVEATKSYAEYRKRLDVLETGVVTQ